MSRHYGKFNEEALRIDLLGQKWTDVYRYQDLKVICNIITDLFTEGT